METALPTSITRALESVDHFAAEGHRAWFDLAYKFLAWERQSVMLGKADLSEKDKAAHRKALLYFLKVTEFMAGISPNDSDLETLRWRLNESWELLCNRNDFETSSRLRKVMADAFPE